MRCAAPRDQSSGERARADGKGGCDTTRRPSNRADNATRLLEIGGARPGVLPRVARPRTQVEAAKAERAEIRRAHAHEAHYAGSATLEAQVVLEVRWRQLRDESALPHTYMFQ